MFLVTLGRAWEGVFGLGDTMGFFFNVRGDLSHKFYTRLFGWHSEVAAGFIFGRGLEKPREPGDR